MLPYAIWENVLERAGAHCQKTEGFISSAAFEVKQMKEVICCRVCQSNQLEELMDLGDQYLSDFREDDIKPPRFPLTLLLCKECFLVQLKHTVSPAYLYTENYGYRSGINGTIRSNLREIVEEVKSILCLQAGDVVVDIGANDGTLFEGYGALPVKKIAFEPIAKLARLCKQHADEVVQDFFPQNTSPFSAKAITAISMFYDLDDPHRFLQAVQETLALEGVFVIQQNYLGDMLKYNALDNIVHEHLEYYSLASLEFLLHRHELEVFRVVRTPINGGSFRTLIGHKGVRTVEESVQQMRREEDRQGLKSQEPYQQFVKRVQVEMKTLSSFIKEQKKLGKNIYLYGASTRGGSLMQFANLSADEITAAVEKNEEKIGKKMSSLQIPIISEEEARIRNPEYMLVLPWFFKEEFLKREEKYLEQGGTFIFPLPAFSLCSQ